MKHDENELNKNGLRASCGHQTIWEIPIEYEKFYFDQNILITAALPLFAGCVERQVVYRDRPVYVQEPPPGGEIVVEQPSEPPPPKVEVITTVAPDPTYVWIGGVWEWRGRWVWVHGRWARPHPGRVWAVGHWEPRSHGSVWISAGWR